VFKSVLLQEINSQKRTYKHLKIEFLHSTSDLHQ